MKAAPPDAAPERTLRLTAQRRAEISVLLEQVRTVRVADLSKKLEVSEVTIRSDLDAMAREGLLIRHHGGAIAHSNLKLATAFEKRAFEHQEQKSTIGRAAADLVQDGSTILLDAGSTIMEFAKCLNERKPLTVVTNALNVAAHVGATAEINVILIGGSLSRETISTVGTLAERDLQSLMVDCAFLGAHAFNVVAGIADPFLEIARVKKAMMACARQKVLLADSSKWDRPAFAKVAPLTEIDIIVSDDGLPEAVRREIEDAGVRLIIAKGVQL